MLKQFRRVLSNWQLFCKKIVFIPVLAFTVLKTLVIRFNLIVKFLWSNIAYVVISERFIDGDKFPYTKFEHPVCW